MTALWVMIGGALGSVCRYGIGVAASRAYGGPFPAGTFVANAAGALLIGVVMAVAMSRGVVDSPVRIALTVGVLGGFTTFSALSYEVVTLISSGRMGLAVGYLGGSAVVGVAFAALGMWLGGRI